MKVSFQTKEESKQQQRDEFLSLSPVERFNRFLQLMQASNAFYHQTSDYPKVSFILKRKKWSSLIKH